VGQGYHFHNIINRQPGLTDLTVFHHDRHRAWTPSHFGEWLDSEFGQRRRRE
jgi:hypothetical protein